MSAGLETFTLENFEGASTFLAFDRAPGDRYLPGPYPENYAATPDERVHLGCRSGLYCPCRLAHLVQKQNPGAEP